MNSNFRTLERTELADCAKSCQWLFPFPVLPDYDPDVALAPVSPPTIPIPATMSKTIPRTTNQLSYHRPRIRWDEVRIPPLTEESKRCVQILLLSAHNTMALLTCLLGVCATLQPIARLNKDSGIPGADAPRCSSRCSSGGRATSTCFSIGRCVQPSLPCV
jgi:hypothetical protein